MAYDKGYNILWSITFFFKKGFDLDKHFVHNFQDEKVFRIWIKSHKGAVEELFNMLLSLYLVFNVSMTMVKLIAFNGQVVLWEV